MSEIFPIAADPRFRITTATGGQTAFSVPFPFQDNDDIAVVRIALDGTQTPLDEGPDYVLTGAGNESGGTVSLALPAVAGEKVVRAGAAVIDRVRSVVRSGRFSSRAVDDDLDRFIIIAQELFRDSQRSLKVPLGSSVSELPPPAANKFWKWDATGEKVQFVDILQSGEIAVSAFMQGLLGSANSGEVRDALDLPTFPIGTGDIQNNAITNDKVATGLAGNKVIVQQAGTGMVPQGVQSWMRFRTPHLFDANPGLGAIGVTTSGARADNLGAFQAMLAAFSRVELPAGHIYLPDDARIHMGSGRSLVGKGSFFGGTHIHGDGNVLVWEAADGLDSRMIKGFRIENENLANYDVILTCTFPAGITECRMEDVYFGHGLRHFTVNGFCVGWKIRDCTFEYATGVSRLIGGSTVYKEINCYTKNNAAGIQFDGAVYGHFDTYLGGVFEQTAGTAVLMRTITSDRIIKGFHTDAWFEANGLAGGSGDIRLQATGSGTFSNVSVWDASFPSHSGTTQTVRIDRSGTAVAPVTGGKYFLEGAVPLTA